MPDFHPTSEVIYSYPLLTFTFNHAPLYWSGFRHFLQDIAHAPLAVTHWNFQFQDVNRKDN
jgi:hypothetical protein